MIQHKSNKYEGTFRARLEAHLKLQIQRFRALLTDLHKGTPSTELDNYAKDVVTVGALPPVRNDEEARPNSVIGGMSKIVDNTTSRGYAGQVAPPKPQEFYVPDLSPVKIRRDRPRVQENFSNIPRFTMEGKVNI